MRELYTGFEYAKVSRDRFERMANLLESTRHTAECEDDADGDEAWDNDFRLSVSNAANVDIRKGDVMLLSSMGRIDGLNRGDDYYLITES